MGEDQVAGRRGVPGAHRASRRSRRTARLRAVPGVRAHRGRDGAALGGGRAAPSARTSGLKEPGLDRVIRTSYELLGLISFLTAGEDECRAWTIRRGTRAQQAAGEIHSDIERGFIRAEVVAFEDLMKAGSLAACREQGDAAPGGQGVRRAGRRRHQLPLQRLMAARGATCPRCRASGGRRPSPAACTAARRCPRKRWRRRRPRAPPWKRTGPGSDAGARGQRRPGDAGDAARPARPGDRARGRGHLARALGVSAFEASQRRRRGGPDLHRILPAAAAAEEAARLRRRGARRAGDRGGRGPARGARCWPRAAPRSKAPSPWTGTAARSVLAAADLLVIVRGVITREYQTTLEARHQRRLATLDPGYRVHLHRRDDARPVELDPAAFDFGPGGGAQRRAAPDRELDRPALSRRAPGRLVPGGDSGPRSRPAAPGRRRHRRPGPAAAARPGWCSTTSRQFRFHSAWRAAARRRARLTP